MTTWNPVSTWIPSGGPSGPGGAGSVLGGGWIDQSGSTWEITAGNLVQALWFAQGSGPSHILIRPSTENAVDCQGRITFTFNATGADGPIFYVRASGSGGTFQSYAIAVVSSGFNFVTILNGAFPSSGNFNSYGFIDGHNYSATFSAVQTTPTLTTISIQVLDNTDTLLSAVYSVTDSTAVLQNTVGVVAVQDVRASSGNPFTTFNTFATDTDAVAATGITINGPVTGPHGSPSGTITYRSNGILTSSDTVTFTDGGAGGTFSPTTGTLAVGTNTACTTTYTASKAVTILSSTNTGGLANPTAYYAAPNWVQVSTGPWTGGPTSFVGAGVQVDSTGFYDVSGNFWKLDASNNLTSIFNSNLNTGILARAATESAFDSRAVCTFKLVDTDASGPFFSGRYFHTSGGVNGYGIYVQPTGLSIFKEVNGAPTNIAFTLFAISSTDTLSLDIQVIQLIYGYTGATTLIVGTLTDTTTSTVLGTISVQDSTAALQQVTGVIAANYLLANSGDSSPLTSNIKTYTDAVTATAYTVFGPSSGLSGTASAAYTAFSGGILASPVTINLSDNSGGGTFKNLSGTTITSLTLAVGTNTSAQFTYTPGSQGLKTLSFTNSGGLTNPPNLTYQSYATASIGPTDIRFRQSPGNWTTDAVANANQPAGRSIIGCTYRRTWCLGAYLQFNIQAQVSPVARLLANVSNTSSTVYVVIVINGFWNQDIPANGAGGGIDLTALSGWTNGAFNDVVVMIQDSSESSTRWGGGATGTGAFIFTGIVLDTLSTLLAAPNHPPFSSTAATGQWVDIQGDSLEAFVPNSASASPNASVAALTWASTVGRGLGQLGIDWCIRADSTNGFLRPGDGGVPPLYLVNNGVYQGDAASRWNTMDLDGSGNRILLTDANGYISGDGTLNNQPWANIQSMGTNEMLGGYSIADMATALGLWMPRYRAAAPACKLAMLVPFTMAYTGYVPLNGPAYLAAWIATVQAYLPTDKNAAMLNLGNETAQTLVGSAPFADLPHFYANGHDIIGPSILMQLMAAFPIGSTAPAGVGLATLSGTALATGYAQPNKAFNSDLAWSIMFYGSTISGAQYDPITRVLRVLYYGGNYLDLQNQPNSVTNAITNAPNKEAYVLALIAQAQ